MTENRCFILLKRLFIIAGFLVALFLAFSYISSDYPSFLQALLQGVGRLNDYETLLTSKAVLLIYKILKGVILILFVLFVIGLYDSCFVQHTRFSRWTDKWMRRLAAVVWGNILYIRQLDRFTRTSLFVIFSLQFLFLLVFVLSIPFHYDEAWSYIYFSGRGFLQTASFYPLPNNHIFYNLVAGVFDRLPVAPDISTRLPALISHMVAVYYFFKLAAAYFNRGIALFVTVLLATAFPVVMYAVEARGYSFLICFTVMIMYAVNGLVKEPGRKKIRYVYFLSMAAGLYTMPSFLYTIFPINTTLFLYYLLKNQWKPMGYFINDNIKAAILTIIVYAPVVYFTSLDALIKPNGAARQSIHEVLQVMATHLSSTWAQLTGYRGIPFYIAVVLVAATLFAPLLRKGKMGFLSWLTAAMLISPPVILLLHRVVPFERTWVYLAVPLALSIGFVASLVVYYIGKSGIAKKIETSSSWYRAAIGIGVLTGLMVVSHANFRHQHRKHFQIDYNIRDTFHKLGHDIDHISSIGYSSGSLEYYVADDLYFECYKRNREKPVTMHRDNIDYTEDVLILFPDAVDTFQLANYQFVGSFENYYSLFLRKE